MPSLLDRVRHTIQQDDLVPPGSRVVIGLSGGADSVALTVLLADLSSEAAFGIARLAHLNHRLRGAAADEDEAFCRGLAADLGLPIEVDHADVGALARDNRQSIEEAGREARYRFFDRVADLTGADRIAVGHTLEDQAETYLLNLIRGAGSRGLSGMPLRTGRLIRPLLDVAHADLRRFLAGRRQPFREDETNLDTRLPRNRIRHLVIPFLEQQFSPGVAAVLARNAAIAREDCAWLDAEASRRWNHVARPDGNGIVLDCPLLCREAPAVARRIALRALEAASAGRFIGFEHVEALLSMARGEAPHAADLPGLRAEHDGTRMTLRPRAGSGRGTRVTQHGFSYPLPVPGAAVVDEIGMTVTAEQGPRAAGASIEGLVAASSDRVAVVDLATVAGPLRVRSRKAGDRFRPLGLTGAKKLQDFLVDRKVAARDRDKVPLVVDELDRIVWVAGQAICEDFRVTRATEAVVILKLEGQGDRA
jgi:tRNA(Ile)-lysidine synthase